MSFQYPIPSHLSEPLMEGSFHLRREQRVRAIVYAESAVGFFADGGFYKDERRVAAISSLIEWTMRWQRRWINESGQEELEEGYWTTKLEQFREFLCEKTSI